MYNIKIEQMFALRFDIKYLIKIMRYISSKHLTNYTTKRSVLANERASYISL